MHRGMSPPADSRYSMTVLDALARAVAANTALHSTHPSIRRTGKPTGSPSTTAGEKGIIARRMGKASGSRFLPRAFPARKMIVPETITHIKETLIDSRRSRLAKTGTSGFP